MGNVRKETVNRSDFPSHVTAHDVEMYVQACVNWYQEAHDGDSVRHGTHNDDDYVDLEGIQYIRCVNKDSRPFFGSIYTSLFVMFWQLDVIIPILTQLASRPARCGGC